MPHRFWNDGAEPAVFRCVVRPALQFESLIETMFTLAAEGRTNRKGMPNPVRMAAIARAHRDVIRLAGVPAWLQDMGTLAALPLAYAFGYTAPRRQRPRGGSAILASCDARPAPSFARAPARCSSPPGAAPRYVTCPSWRNGVARPSGVSAGIGVR